ncbi:hypothetical protein V5F38_04205 [Xanthobacter sp. V0B-10]|uniref:hypothetical protein n=1 Tax=Xanthobacter albus TaxID=3119929 RepID=UPI0037269A7A
MVVADMIDHGIFEQYIPAPASASDDPALAQLIMIEHPRAIFARRVDGRDWYELQRDGLMSGSLKVLVTDDGAVISAHTDASMLPAPVGLRVVEMDPGEVPPGIDWSIPLQWAGVRIVGGGIVPRSVDLSALKATLCTQIDAAAEAERARYITPGAGQAMTYQTKAAEALALAADHAPDPSAYPLLSAEIGITASDLAGVGAVVRAAYAAWQVIGAGIERARLAGKAAVQAASDEAEARAAAAVEWPAPPA